MPLHPRSPVRVIWVPNHQINSSISWRLAAFGANLDTLAGKASTCAPAGASPMKRVFILTLFACFAFAGCEKPCEPGFKKSGLKCKMIPIRDGGLIGADGGAQSTTSEAGTGDGPDAGMDAAAERAPDSGAVTSFDGGIDAGHVGDKGDGGEGDATSPHEASTGERVIEDGGPAPAPGVTSSQIAAVRAAILAGTSPVALPSMPIDGAVVTYIKPGVGSAPAGNADGPGFLIQNEASGPALLVSRDPASIVPGGLRVGDLIDLEVTEGQVAAFALRISNATARLVGEGVDRPAAQTISDLGVAPILDKDWALESEIVNCTGTVSGPIRVAGSDSSSISIVTAGEPAETTDFVLRAPDSWFLKSGIASGCAVTVTGAPMGRYLNRVQLGVWREENIEVTCPPLAVTSTSPADAAQSVPPSSSIGLTFNQPIAKGSLFAQSTAGSCTGTVLLSSNGFSTCLGFAADKSTLDPTGMIATLTPTTPLSSSKVYTLRVRAGITAINGNELTANQTISFRTSEPEDGCDGSLVVSQIYGGGGNALATWANDYVELHNRGASAVSLEGWSLQSASAAGSVWLVSELPNVSIPGGGYYLVRLASAGANGAPIDDADFTSDVNLGGGAGKVALVSTTTALGAVLPDAAPLVDLVGYGTASAAEGTPVGELSSTTAAIRTEQGCTDGNNNADDFTVSAPVPRNSKSTDYVCPCTSP